MFKVMALILTFSVAPAQPTFWNAKWDLTYRLFSIDLKLAMQGALENPEPNHKLMMSLGEGLAGMNRLAQKPCRRDPATCVRALESLMNIALGDALVFAHAETPLQEARQRRLVRDLMAATADEALRASERRIGEDWRTDLPGRLVTFVQKGVIIAGVTTAAALAVNSASAPILVATASAAFAGRGHGGFGGSKRDSPSPYRGDVPKI